MPGTIPPHPGASYKNTGNPNRTITSSRNVGNPNRGGSHVTNVPTFDVDDFTSWKDRFLVYFDGLEPYLLEILENGPYVPKSPASTSENILIEPQKYLPKKWLMTQMLRKTPGATVNSWLILMLSFMTELPLQTRKRSTKEEEELDKGVTRVKAFMAIAEDELAVGKADARFGQWVEITMKKDYLNRSELGPKVVFRDNSSGDTRGYGSVNYNGITFTKVAYVNGLKHNLISISQLCDANFKVLFTKTQGTIFNQNNEFVLVAPRRRDVYVIDMSSYNEESNTCFFVKPSNSVNWL
ncbi:hypothetical protein Tco_1423170 [Tanacetum coccineum]